MKSIAEALSEILPAFTPRGAVRVDLLSARGLHLVEDVRARFDLPPFDNSAMDGFAVRAADVAGASAESSVTLPLQGESRAGGPMPGPLAPGTCMRIFTGAPLPLGADSVIMQEDCERVGERDGESVAIRLASTPGKHVRAGGEDVQADTVMLAAGTRLGPGEIGLLASQGYASVSVHRRPRVALLSTGDELRDVSDPPRPGSIVNSNAYALAAQVREAGGVPWILPIVPDRLDATVASVQEGLQADVVLSIGGVSVGEYDFVRDAFAQAGVSQEFWKVAIKPGKPLSFGTRDGVPVIGLPGNPVSAMVTFEVFVRPGLRRMLGHTAPFRGTAEVPLEVAHRHKTGRTELARATLHDTADGLVVRPHVRQGSGALSSMVGVDALVILPADQREFAAGERLTALLLDDERGTEQSPFR